MAPPPDKPKAPPVILKDEEEIDLFIEINQNPCELRALQLDPAKAQAVGDAMRTLLGNLPREAFAPDGVEIHAPQNVPQEETEVRPTPRRPMRPEPADKPQLPVVPNTLPVDQRLVNIQWGQIKQLPGYTQQAIRWLGREVFRCFPDFREFEAAARKNGKDGLGEVGIISDWTHGQTETNYVASQIMALAKAGRAQHVRAEEMGFDRFYPGYKPQILVTMSAGWTFLMVKETRANGAPADANYIYVWKGGFKKYLKNNNPVAAISGPSGTEEGTAPDSPKKPFLSLPNPFKRKPGNG